MRSAIKIVCMAGIVAVWCSAGSIANGATNVTGDVEPGELSTWTSRTPVYIGKTGVGGLTVDSGELISGGTFLGHESGSSGAVTVNGVGSIWTIANYLYIGDYGQGELNIANGGIVSDRDGYIGGESGSTGAVTVSGVGSTWINSSRLYVGHDGEGSLNIVDSGLVEVSRETHVTLNPGSVGSINFNNGTLTTGGFLSAATALSGTGIINTNGVVSDLDMVFDATHGLTQTLTLTGPGRDITVNLGVDGLTAIGVGHSGEGSMHVSDGVTVESTNGYLGYQSGSIGTATVSGAGSTWTDSLAFHIGYYGQGNLEITNGGSLSSRYAYIGEKSGSMGSATVSGGDSTWVSSTMLSIGSYGQGELEVTDGGTVNSGGGDIGLGTGSTGIVTVSGAGSTWTISGGLSIGYHGDGVLNIVDGGLVNVHRPTHVWSGPANAVNFDNGVLTTGGFLGVMSSLNGTGVVNTNGLVSDQDLVFDSAHGLNRTLTFNDQGQNITMHLDVNGSGPIGVGYSGTSSLQISDGLTVQSTNGYIGYGSGSIGTATVSGAGSTWSNSSDLSVGLYGRGTLDITNGGTVMSRQGRIGRELNSVGTVTVRGDQAFWTNSSNLEIGGFGQAVLEITGGGYVSNYGGYIGYQFGSLGKVTVSGSDSRWYSSKNMHIGTYGQGVLNIAAGGLVSVNGDTYVAREPGAVGAINFNYGTLTTGGFMGPITALSGTGVIHTRGLVSDLDIIFDATHGLNQTLTFNDSERNITVNLAVNGSGSMGAGYIGSGSMHVADGLTLESINGYLGYQSGSIGTAKIDGYRSAWANDKDLYVGYFGNGVLDITNRGVVSTGNGYVGREPGSKGAVTVSGLRSIWTSLGLSGYSQSGKLYIGHSGEGKLDVTNRATVETKDGYIGYGSDSIGTVTVSSSIWSNSRNFYVGYSGDGKLEIIDAGHVSSAMGYVGYSSDSTGTVTVSAGSRWSPSYSYIGFSGEGRLDVTDRGTVYDRTGYVGYQSNSANAVTVSGAGSMWANSDSLYVGYRGKGTLDITDGGLVKVTGSMTIDYEGNGTSYVTMASGGKLALAGDAGDSLGDFLSLIEGSDDIRFWDDSVSDWADIAGATAGEDYILTYLTEGDLAGYTVLTVTAVPEPVTISIFALGGLAMIRRRRRKLEVAKPLGEDA